MIVLFLAYRPKRCLAAHARARPPRIMLLARPPLPICLNILAICAYWRRSWFTSCTLVPRPAAMRLRRVPEMISWLRRSLGVMELMMASRRTNCFSSTCSAACCRPAKGPTEGSIFKIALHGAELLDLAQLVAEVFEREAVAEEGFLGELLGLFAVEGGFGLLDERHHVAHAEDAADDAVGMEGLEGVGLFAHADELDGLAGDVADGERRAAAGVAVHFGEDDAGEAEAGVEVLRGVDGVLAGHGVGDEENLLRD